MSTATAADAVVWYTSSLVSRYLAGVALTLCAYDWLVLIERESQTAWKSRWTRTKAIYYLNRVISLAGLALTIFQTADLRTDPLSQQFCQFYIWFYPMLQLLSVYLSNIILTLRVVALYNRHLVITRILYSSLVLNWLLTFIPALHTSYLWALSINYVPSLHACLSPVYSPSEPIIFIAPAIFEGMLFAFTLYRAIMDYRNGVIAGYANARFLAVLYRDGFYYFAAVGAVYTWNAFQYLLSPTTGTYMGVYFSWAVMTVLSSRVYLNLVLVASGGGRDGVTTGTMSSFRDGRANHPEGIDMEVEPIETFGAKRIHRRVPLTTFATTIVSVESNTPADAEPVSAA